MNWAIIAVVITILCILLFFRRFEKAEVSAKEIALIATMTTFAGISRIPLCCFPSFQPTTFVDDYRLCFWGTDGFMVGAMSALVSNFS